MSISVWGQVVVYGLCSVSPSTYACAAHAMPAKNFQAEFHPPRQRAPRQPRTKPLPATGRHCITAWTTVRYETLAHPASRSQPAVRSRRVGYEAIFGCIRIAILHQVSWLRLERVFAESKLDALLHAFNIHIPSSRHSTNPTYQKHHGYQRTDNIKGSYHDRIEFATQPSKTALSPTMPEPKLFAETD
ncbi:uncharacterized protein CC84DRAFT_731578 [Paraphaeosphaeria sporulosa]|uniref:Uncharacterized protein n=1 Tax=Paraphaeosphaeria sporulosa TaxID=1460663 RepID=A0A177CDI2_9PLEO|nr:uncharacterized protein CC84DRAFT_731578 [Paraphaeosphaeria sporulosa]OAG05704.1 hypothetical protein CC84DRAFT_731578 [Paraphaeosphaeria sporulosa]